MIIRVRPHFRRAAKLAVQEPPERGLLRLSRYISRSADRSFSRCERRSKSALFWRQSLLWRSVSTMEHPRARPYFGSFFCSTAPQAFFRPDRRSLGRRAQELSRSAGTPPLRHTPPFPGRALTASSTAADWIITAGRTLGRRVSLRLLRLLRDAFVGGFSVDIHVACDGRISLYPAAPFRLATLLHAWTIAQVGRGSSLTRQTGWPDLRIPITATPPTRPTHPKERRNCR